MGVKGATELHGGKNLEAFPQKPYKHEDGAHWSEKEVDHPCDTCHGLLLGRGVLAYPRAPFPHRHPRGAGGTCHTFAAAHPYQPSASRRELCPGHPAHLRELLRQVPP